MLLKLNKIKKMLLYIKYNLIPLFNSGHPSLASHASPHQDLIVCACACVRVCVILFICSVDYCCLLLIVVIFYLYELYA